MKPIYRLMRELAENIRDSDNRFHLLRSIDEMIVGGEIDINKAIVNVCLCLKRVLKVSKVGAYFISGTKLKTFEIPLEHNEQAIFIPKTASLKISDNVSIHEEGWPTPDGKCTLLIPILWKNAPILVIILQDNDIPYQASHLIEPDAREYCDSISKQLSILLEKAISGDIDKCHKEIIQAYFYNPLQTVECWFAIASALINFFPNWKPAILPESTRFQILTYVPGADYLVLCADDGDANNIMSFPKPIRIEKSISGILIEKHNDGFGVDYPYLNVNPNDHIERYQSYLFGAAIIPKSELVVPMFHAGELCGVINMEAEEEHAFHLLHIEILRMAAEYLGPFVGSLIAREKRRRLQMNSVLEIQSRLLKKMASVYKHKVGHSILQSRFAMEHMFDSLKNFDNVDFSRYLSELSDAVDQFKERSDSFLVELPKFIEYGGVDICSAITGAVGEFDLKWSKEHIKLIYKGLLDNYDNEQKNRILVWASPLLREHIYNLVNNSIEAIEDNISRKNIGNGEICFELTYTPGTDFRHNVTAPARVTLIISDNGGGVSEQAKDEILKFGCSFKKGGTGFGLSAAKEYLQSINGDLVIDNRTGVGLSVTITMQEFAADYHMSGHY